MWPEVHYFGVVKNSNSEKVVALLEINRRRYFSRVGDDLDEIRCFFIHNDSIGLEFQNAQRFFMRNGIRNDEYY
ncbi:hypothetical protein JCM15548_14366 [Geofilum rubicundum JCM 15548]|uniref:Uncharacterized protein n=2 Tax=Geofilum TaxID=1236988 RepID=A0A0E9M3G2_9BACT|nr:hypothetical protein JCM15548_14366 [Geofilum rubicundum JCM 15548]